MIINLLGIDYINYLNFKHNTLNSQLGKKLQKETSKTPYKNDYEYTSF